MATVHVGINSVKDLYKTETVGKADPYVVVRMGDQKAQTKTKKRAGRSADFGESFIFKYGNEHQIFFEVYDAETMKSDKLVGTGSLDVHRGINWTGDITLTRTGNPPVDAGTVSARVYTE